MESLTEKVYECTLAVEAHMICDLLSQAGISARVDGEFMQSAMGEIPVGNAVKVRVDPARAAEAREVIADWEKQQPIDPIAVPVTKTSRIKSPLWFLSGAMLGGFGVFLVFYVPVDSRGIDYDGDGNYEVILNYTGVRQASTELDRNSDRWPDVRWTYDLDGFEDGFASDDDFDGKFEWRGEMLKGQTRAVRIRR